MFDADGADDFTDRPKSFIEIQSDIFRGVCVLHGFTRAIASFEGASEAIAMAEVDRQGILGLQILFANAGKNFVFESIQAVARCAGDPDRVAIFPVVMLPKVVLVQYYDLIPIGGALRDMGRARRISINNMQAQISLLERTFGACDSDRKSVV